MSGVSNGGRVPKVYARAEIGGVWGVLRPGDRRPFKTSATKEGALKLGLEIADTVLVLNAYHKVVEERFQPARGDWRNLIDTHG